MQLTIIRHALVAISIAVLTACTNNSIVLKTLYNQLDRVLNNELLDYADFNSAQEQHIRAAVDETVNWHRTSALPIYVQTMKEAETRLLKQNVSRLDINWLFSRARSLARDFEIESPILRLLNLMQELNDAQVEQIVVKLNKELADEEKIFKKQLAKYKPRTQAKISQSLAEESSKSAATFFNRLGLKLNPAQTNRLKTYLQDRQLTDHDRLPVWRDWTNTFISILRNRQQDNFQQRFTDHYQARITLIEQAFPARYQHDRRLYQTMLLDLFQNLEEQQKSAMRVRLKQLSEVALELSKIQ